MSPKCHKRPCTPGVSGSNRAARQESFERVLRAGCLIVQHGLQRGSHAMAGERPGRVERRLAAILAADVAGYSRLMGLDEAGTARTLREHRVVSDALVAKHGGRIVKTTGDGVLIEFPSVVDAGDCAVAVQVLMAEPNQDVPPDRRMLYRIGINL